MLTVVVPVAFGRQVWLGGVNYFRNLLKASNTYSAGRFRVVLLTGKPEQFADLDGPYASVVMCRMLDFRNAPIALGSRILQRLTNRNPALFSIVRGHNPDVISHGHAGVQSLVPSLPWMPDFQHRALPHLFSARDYAGRESLMKICGKLGHLLLSSESAREDFERYYPSMRHVKPHVLRFPAMGGPNQDVKPLSELRERHSIPERYVYLPNQFWAHKNHGVVIDALARTRSDVTVVCTGSSSDLRNDSYFSGLMDRVRNANLESRFRVLGLVEYSDVVALMHHAMAVLNPSLFEGWSTPVEEAKAQGKLMILSSLPVHREQAQTHRARFFPPEDADALAELLDEVASNPPTPPLNAEQSAAAAALNQQKFIDDYFRIVQALAATNPKAARAV
jgi:glycosyltransferase involved in cell wall biosynthesis